MAAGRPSLPSTGACVDVYFVRYVDAGGIDGTVKQGNVSPSCQRGVSIAVTPLRRDENKTLFFFRPRLTRCRFLESRAGDGSIVCAKRHRRLGSRGLRPAGATCCTDCALSGRAHRADFACGDGEFGRGSRSTLFGTRRQFDTGGFAAVGSKCEGPRALSRCREVDGREPLVDAPVGRRLFGKFREGHGGDSAGAGTRQGERLAREHGGATGCRGERLHPHSAGAAECCLCAALRPGNHLHRATGFLPHAAVDYVWCSFWRGLVAQL